MKAMKKNFDEIWNALLNFLNAKDIVIDETGELCAVDYDDEYYYIQQLYSGKYVSIDKISSNEYKNANWRIDGESMTIDEFAYHLRQKAFDVKHRILMQLLKFLKKGIMIDYDDNPSAFFKANSLEEILIKNELNRESNEADKKKCI